MEQQINRYNIRVEKTNSRLDRQSRKLWDEWQAGNISIDQARDGFTGLLKVATGKVSSTWATRYKRRFGWVTKKLSAPGSHLGLNHPKCVVWRERWRQMLQAKKVNPMLLLTYDQVWRLKFRGSKDTLHKKNSESGLWPVINSNFASIHIACETWLLLLHMAAIIAAL